MTTAAVEKLIEALGKIDEAQESLTEAETAVNAAMDMLDDGEEEVDPPDPEDGEYFGGPPGSNGRKVIENKTFQQTDLEDYANTDLVNCTFTKALYDLTLPKSLRLLSCKLKGIKAPDDKSYLFYVNNGHAEKQINFVMDDCLFEGCSAKACGFEFKASEIYMFRCRQAPDCNISQTIRQRHGRMGVYEDCEGFTQMVFRGWGHYIKNCRGAKVTLYAGNLPARYDQWKNMHEAGGGNNMQCAELVYVEGVGPIQLGKEGNNSPHPYPALDCIIGPNCGEVTKLSHKSTDFNSTLQSHLDLWDICGLTPTEQAHTA